MSCTAQLLGRLVRDVEVFHTTGGTAIYSGTVAYNRRVRNGGGEWTEKGVFIPFKIFGARGKAFAEYHAKGDQVYLVGTFDQESWNDKLTGDKRTVLKFIADQWCFVGVRRNRSVGADEVLTGGGENDDQPF